MCIPIKEEKLHSSNQNKELKNLKKIETKEKVKKKKKGKKNVDDEEVNKNYYINLFKFQEQFFFDINN